MWQKLRWSFSNLWSQISPGGLVLSHNNTLELPVFLQNQGQAKKLPTLRYLEICGRGFFDESPIKLFKTITC